MWHLRARESERMEKKKQTAIYPMNLNANKFTSTELKRKIQMKGNEIVAWDAYRHEERV